MDILCTELIELELAFFERNPTRSPSPSLFFASLQFLPYNLGER